MTNKSADKSQVATIARAMLEGTLNYLQGAEQLVEIRDELGIYANDPDFVVFIAVLSEIDYLRSPDGSVDWAHQMNGQFRHEIQQSIDWAKEISLAQCQSLSIRYGK